MKSPSDLDPQDSELRAKILGMGERSIRKSYYPALLRQMDLLERYRALLNQATNAICLLSLPELRFIDSNQSARQLFGFNVARQTELQMPSLIDNASAEAISQWVETTTGEAAQHLHLEARTFDQGGPGLVVDIWLTRVRFGGNDFLVCVAQDVTERKDAELRLHHALEETEAARAKIDIILRSVGDGLLVVGPDGGISLLNPAGEEVFGLAAQGRPYREVIEENCLRQQIGAILEGEERSLLCEWVQRGEFRIYRAKSSPVLGYDGRPGGVITILRDITREKELDRMKDEFISAAAHELRTPLTALMGYAELLNSPEDFGTLPAVQQQEFLSIIYDKSLQLNRIVDDLLDLSMLQSGRVIDLQPRRSQLGPVLERMMSSWRQTAAGHRFDLRLPQDPLTLDFDQEKITQLLENLLGNAVKFSPEGGTVTVSACRKDDYCHVSVTDEGIGIAEEHRSRIFDKFYRVDASDTGFAGLGLGLSISRQIVEAHGGRIWVESGSPRGTMVRFTLPLPTAKPNPALS